MKVESCEICGGACGPSAELPPCLCRLEPVATVEGAPRPKGEGREALALRCPACGAFLEAGVRRCGYCSVELATVRCWCCFALAFAGRGHCSRCGSRLGLEGDLGPTGMTCCGCEGDVFHTIDVGEHRIAECPACTSVLVDHDTLAAITHAREVEAGLRLTEAEAERPAPGPARVVYRKCPACGKVMNRTNFGRSSGVIVDVCKAHGVFFDREELTAVLEFVARGGLAKARRREAQEAKDELARRRMEALLEQKKASRVHAHQASWSSSGAILSALSGYSWW